MMTAIFIRAKWITTYTAMQTRRITVYDYDGNSVMKTQNVS